MTTSNEFFRQVRKQRQLSLQKLSQSAGSPAAISDFENGKTSLAVDTLIELLGELQITVYEFFNADNALQANPFYQLLYAGQVAVDHQDIPALRDLIAKIERLNAEHYQLKQEVLLLDLKLLLTKKEGGPADEKTVAALADYFWSLNVWTNFDVAMYGNVVAFFNSATILSLTLEILAELPPQLLTGQLGKVKLETALNAWVALIQRREQAAAYQLQARLESITLSADLLLDRLYLQACQLFSRQVFEPSPTVDVEFAAFWARLEKMLTPLEFADFKKIFNKK